MGKRKVVDDIDSGTTGVAARQACGRSAPEVIDLAEDSPPPSVSGPDNTLKLNSTSTDPEDSFKSAEEQRQKIMAHAASANSRKRIKPASNPLAPASSPQKTKDPKTEPAAAAADEAARQAIMQHAAQLPPSNSLLAQLHAERLARQQLANPQQHDEQSAQHRATKQEVFKRIAELRLLTYNVWFEEDIALQERMSAIGDIIQEQNYPHFICFQEVTQRIYHLFQQSPWWHRYGASQPAAQPYFTALLYRKDTFKPAGPFQSHDFSNSSMGRGVLSIAGTVQAHKFRVATSHLESPCGHNQMFSSERAAQCKKGLAMLNTQGDTDILWAGDMNWNAADGDPPLLAGWVDAWTEQNPKDPGLTYDGKRNPMLGPYNRLRSRLDRVFCKMSKYKLASVVMVGTQAIAGVTYTRSYKKGPTILPVLPSDHFGLLASFKCNM